VIQSVLHLQYPMRTVTVVLVPFDGTQPLQNHAVSYDELEEDNGIGRRTSIHPPSNPFHDSINALLRRPEEKEQGDDGAAQSGPRVVAFDPLETPLLRPRENVPGLYAYFHAPEKQDNDDDDDVGDKEKGHRQVRKENIRATRLAMACGLFRLRFYGNVVAVRSGAVASSGQRWYDLDAKDLMGPCCVSPDLRYRIQQAVAAETTHGIVVQVNQNIEDEKEVTNRILESSSLRLPDWLADAAQQNYQDGAALAQLALVMNISAEQEEESDTEEESDDTDDDEEEEVNPMNQTHKLVKPQPPTTAVSSSTIASTGALNPSTNREDRSFVTHVPLCLHCRRPSSVLCPECSGATFCPMPRPCRQEGWSHFCHCPTWKVYATRRKELSTFDNEDHNNNHNDAWGPTHWSHQLMLRSFQLSEEPYKTFLAQLGISSVSTSWWRTELDGWAGGQRDSATIVDITLRRSYMEGFHPLEENMLPPQHPVTQGDYDRAGHSPAKKNAVGLTLLSSWKDYYQFRGIPSRSPVALLCTFPLTVYHAIVQYGEVPATVAQMLQRPLRIHVVGAEKELHCLDLFQEVGFLLPSQFQVGRRRIASPPPPPTRVLILGGRSV
jgi:hypothetical protein